MKKGNQKQPPMLREGTTKPMSERHLSPVMITLICVIVAALLGLFGYYHTQQKEVWETRLNQMKEELDRKKQELDRVTEDLKVRAERESKQPLNESAKGQPAGTNQVTVLKNQTMSVASDLKITLTDVTFETNPPRYQISAKVAYDGKPEMQIHNAKEGYLVSYPDEHGYDIELIKADSVSAKFLIKKNP